MNPRPGTESRELPTAAERRATSLSLLAERTSRVLCEAERVLLRPGRAAARNLSTALLGSGLDNPARRELVGEAGYRLGRELRALGLRFRALADLLEAGEVDGALAREDSTADLCGELAADLELLVARAQGAGRDWLEQQGRC